MFPLLGLQNILVNFFRIGTPGKSGFARRSIFTLPDDFNDLQMIDDGLETHDIDKGSQKNLVLFFAGNSPLETENPVAARHREFIQIHPAIDPQPLR